MSTMTDPSIAVLALVCKALGASEHIAVGAAVDGTGRLHLWPTVNALTTIEEVTALRWFSSVTNVPMCWHAEVHS